MISIKKKLRDYFLNQKQRNEMPWQDLAQHYNFCIAKGIEELGKLGPNEYDYLNTLKSELINRLDNPQNIIGVISEIVKKSRND